MLPTSGRPPVRALRTLGSTLVLGVAARALQVLAPSLGDGIVLRLDEPFWLLAAWAFGPAWGSVAALIATFGSDPTVLSLVFVAEALCFGVLVRRGVMAVLAVAPFWIAVDALVAAGVLALPEAATAKQTVNAMLSALAAKGLLIVPAVRRGLGVAADGSDTPLRHQVRRALVPAIAASLALLVVGLGRLYADALEREGTQALSAAADNVALRLDDYMRASEGDVRLLAQLLSVEAQSSAAMSRLLVTHHEAGAPQFLTMLVSDHLGRIVVGSQRRDGMVSTLPGGATVADRPYFTEPARTGRPFRSNGFQGRGFGREPIVAISAPYADGEGRFAGVVEGSLDLGQFGEWLRLFVPPEGASVMVLDDSSHVVASSGPHRVSLLLSGSTLPDVVASLGRRTGRFVESAANAGTWRPTTHVAVRREVTAGGWQVHLRRSVRDMQAPLVVYYWTCTLWLVGCLLVAPPLAGWLSRRIAEPLEALAQSAHEIGRMPSSVVPMVPEAAPREVKLLRNELSAMATQLNDTLASLDRKVHERTAELAAATAKNDTIFTAAMDGMLMLNGGQITHVNDALCRMTGHSHDELLSMSVQDLAPTVALDVRVARRAELESRGQSRFDATIRTKDRRDIPVEVVATAVPHARGHAFAVVRDISERRRAEAERQRFEMQVRQSQKLEAVDTLAGGIAHEFSNVLAVIAGNVELGQSDLPLDHPVHAHLTSAHRAVVRATGLVRQILAFSRHRDERRDQVEVSALVAMSPLLRAPPRLR